MSAKAIRKIEAKIEDSVKWIGDHFPDSYADATKCEKCYLGGLCFALAALKGTDPQEEYQRAISRVKKKPKKRAVKKRVVVRRKK